MGAKKDVMVYLRCTNEGARKINFKLLSCFFYFTLFIVAFFAIDGASIGKFIYLF